MGLNFSFAAYSDVRSDGRLLQDAGELDPTASHALLERIHPRTEFDVVGEATLLDCSIPPQGRIYVGVYPDVTLVSAKDLYLFNPSRLKDRFLKVAGGRDVHLFSQRSSIDMFAYARWDGALKLRRAVSVNPIGRVWENLGVLVFGILPVMASSGWVWVPAPGWPRCPAGWVPPPGWVPDPSWPPAPAAHVFWRPVRNHWPAAIYTALLGLLFLGLVGEAVTGQVAWAFAQPASTDTITPSVHALWGLAAMSVLLGLLLGLTRLRMANRSGAFCLLMSVAVVVSLAASAVAFVATGMVSLAQPCTGDTCDIAAAPAGLMVAAAVAVVATVCSVGACMCVAAVRLLVPASSGWRLGEGG